MSNLPETTNNLIFSCLSPAELHRYSLSHKSGYLNVQSYKLRAYNITSRLAHFFSPAEIIIFRYYQSKTGMLISGSTALQFFDRSDYPGSDLDLYVEHRYAGVIGEWLQRLGYLFVPREKRQSHKFGEAHREARPGDREGQGIFCSDGEGYFGRGVAGVFNFHKYHPDRKIQLITSLYSPLEVILHFHSTCVMNIISHNTAYSFYPYATFEQRRSLICATEGSKQDEARKKYVSRGWTMEPSLNAWETLDRYSDFRRGNRWVGDRACWRMKILPDLDLGPDFVDSNSWEHSYSDDVNACMEFMILHTPALRHSYLLADNNVAKFLVDVFAVRTGRTEQESYDEDINKLLCMYYLHVEHAVSTNYSPHIVGRAEGFAICG